MEMKHSIFFEVRKAAIGVNQANFRFWPIPAIGRSRYLHRTLENRTKFYIARAEHLQSS